MHNLDNFRAGHRLLACVRQSNKYIQNSSISNVKIMLHYCCMPYLFSILTFICLMQFLDSNQLEMIHYFITVSKPYKFLIALPERRETRWEQNFLNSNIQCRLLWVRFSTFHHLAYSWPLWWHRCHFCGRTEYNMFWWIAKECLLLQK